MTEARCEAVHLAQFYFRRIAESAGWQWDGDNDAEVEMMVSFIIDAARADLHDQLDDALNRIRALEDRQPDYAGDAADPDRPETWAFGEPPVTAYPDHELSPAPEGHGQCPETGDGEHCGDWHDGGRCMACGQYGPDLEVPGENDTPALDGTS